jgi:putative peptidoglycan lipid II flippase
MFKSIFTNSFGILVSRITGFIRDMLQASILGANIYSDIFIVAFKLPNLFRRVFAEGAFTQSFMPTFASSLQKGLFSFTIFKKFLSILILMTIVVYIFSEYFTKLIAWGFSYETIQKAAPLVAINFNYLILIFIVTFFASLLQYKNHFATTAFSTSLLNISMIVALILSKELTKQEIIYNLSFGVVIGGVLQLLVHIIAIRWFRLDRLFYYGFIAYKRKKNKIQRDIKRFNRGFLNSIVGGSTAQISAFLDGFLASFLVSGSISYLYYANRVFQFPLALFAIATSIAIFPRIAKYLNSNQELKARTILKSSFWLLIFSLSLAVIVGITFSKEIVWLLYQRGAFSIEDTLNTSIILSVYLIGLLPFGISKIFSLWLYSTHNQAQAAKISIIALGVNVVLSLAFIYPLKAVGLALASSMSGFVLLILTIKYFGLREFLEIIKSKLWVYYIVFLAIIVLVALIFKGYTIAIIQL